MTECKGIINSFESFGAVDGPGVRFIVFMQGCNMRCRYCHNPETWSREGQEFTVDEVVEKALRYESYWGENGGVTVSGGEPLLQMNFLIGLFKALKENGVNTALDTSGSPFEESSEYLDRFDTLMAYTDLVIADIKLFDEEQHRNLTGRSNENILSMIRYLSEIGKPVWIRRVLVPGLTDDEDDLKRTAQFIGNMDNIQRIEVLPYHSMGIQKWEKLGLRYTLYETKSPDSDEIERTDMILSSHLCKK